MDYWYLAALMNLVLLIILRLLTRRSHHPHHLPGEGLTFRRLVRGSAQ